MKKGKIGFIFLLFCLIPGLILAATGKIRGTVKDMETGDPLIGANIVIQGTIMGAATDENGEFIILNVPVGKYNLVATYLGYQKVTVTDLVVNEGLTTYQNFAMSKQVLEGKEVVIVAEKPLVNKNATNDIKIIRGEVLENIPIRGYANVISAQVGAVRSGNAIYVRGGRLDEVGYYVDGVLMNNPYDRERTGDVSQNALEEINYQPGGMSAEYGLFNSGVISTTTKVGGPEYAISGEVISDQFLGYNEKKFGLGTYSYGYNLYTLSASGPVPYTDKKLRFYANAEYRFMKDRNPTWGPSVKPSAWDPDVKELLKLNPEPISVYGAKPNNSSRVWTGTGNLYYDLKSLKLKVGGHVFMNDFRDYDHTYAPFNWQNMPIGSRDVYTAYGKATWVINPQTFIEFNANYYTTFYEEMDSRHKKNFLDYADPAKNPNLEQWGRVPFRDEFARFHTYGRVYGLYSKEDISRMSFKVDGTWQINTIHELKAGGEAQISTIRFYSVLPWRLSAILQGQLPSTEEELINAYRNAYADNAGYDITGENEVNSGRDDARRPKIYSAYVTDKMEFRDMVLNLGLRVDHIVPDQQRLKDPYNIGLDENGLIADTSLIPAKTFTEINPRFGISFPVTDQTVFHLEYGKFTQPAAFNVTYITWQNLAANLQQGNFTTSPNPGLEPVKTTSYEVGFEQQIGANAAIDITAFYKEIRDQVYLLAMQGARPSVYSMYINGDFGNVKGFSFDFRLRRIARVMANVNYTLQWANGTGSDPDTQFNIAWQNPNERPTYVAPLDYDQRHTATVNIDFRTQPKDGPRVFGVYPLGEFGINIWYSLGSGLAYTPMSPISIPFSTAGSRYPTAAINSSHQPSTQTVNLRVDKQIRVGKLVFNPYVWVINLFNTKNVIDVYEATGLPDDDGWLSTVEGQQWALTHPTAAKWYHYRINDPENYDEPRQIRVGLRVDFK